MEFLERERERESDGFLFPIASMVIELLNTVVVGFMHGCKRVYERERHLKFMYVCRWIWQLLLPRCRSHS